MAMTFFNSKQTENAAQNIVDASLGYEWKKTMITLYGTNLTNEDSYTVGFDVGANPIDGARAVQTSHRRR